MSSACHAEIQVDGGLGNRRSIQLSYGASLEFQRNQPKTIHPAHTPPTPSTTEDACSPVSSTTKLGRRTATLLTRLLAKVSPEPNSGCWLFAGSDNGDGYGVIGVSDGGGRWHNELAHRVMYEAHRGPIAPGLVVMHLCDVRCCVNPSHLRVGTVSENNLDMMRKKRHPNVQPGRRRRPASEVRP